MIISKVTISLFRTRAVLGLSLGKCHVVHYHGRVNTIAKRGSMLKEMVANKDKRKNWHFSIITDKPRAKVFEKVHKPHRRRSVLNNLFIRNITDVISTGEVFPELSYYGIEITGVQTSPCCKLLNVFWQVPVSKYDCSEDIGKLLSIAAPKIRAELISRNVLGRVPMIFFIRDCTNSRVAAFELAMQKLQQEPKSDSSIIPDDSFTNDIFTFKEAKCKSIKNNSEPDKQEKKENVDNPKEPIDMKCDVFGLNHSEMMNKVVALKNKVRLPPQNSAVICPESLENEEDIFSKIPGVCFKADSSSISRQNRDAILKRFHIERKMLMEKHKVADDLDDSEYYEEGDEENDIECNTFDDDYFEDETMDH